MIIFFKLVTATIAIINFALFLIPGHPAYWETTIGILGKLYSNTMMVVLNNRIVFKGQDDLIRSNESSVPSHPEVSQGLVFSVPQDSISVTRERWAVPLDVYKMPVSIRYPNFPPALILIFRISFSWIEYYQGTRCGLGYCP